MREAKFTTRFKKDLKRQKKRGKKPDRIKETINAICAAGEAPPACKPHKLSGNWSGYSECHIEPDWLLIYRAGDNEVIFYRTGTHSDLFR